MKTDQQLRDEKLEALEKSANLLIGYIDDAPDDRLRAALAMPTKAEAEKPRHFMHPSKGNFRFWPDGRCEYLRIDWERSTRWSLAEVLDPANGWAEYFPEEVKADRIGGFTVRSIFDAAKTIQQQNEDGPQKIKPSDNPFYGLVLDINRPYLPLPEEGLVVLPSEIELPGARLIGWMWDGKRWFSGVFIVDDWRIYAAPRNSAVARLNWEAILNAELAELGAPKCPTGYGPLRIVDKNDLDYSKGLRRFRWLKGYEGWIQHNPRNHREEGAEIYLEAVKDEREEKSPPRRDVGPVVPGSIQDLQGKVIRLEAVIEELTSVPTERQKMAAVIFAGYMANGNTAGSEAFAMAFSQADLIMGREDGK